MLLSAGGGKVRRWEGERRKESIWVNFPQESFLLIVSLLTIYVAFPLQLPSCLLSFLFPVDFALLFLVFDHLSELGHQQTVRQHFEEHGREKKVCSFYENNPKAFFFFLTSSLLIKLSCQEHINNRRHNSLHRGREKKSTIGEKRNDFSFCRVETVHHGHHQAWSKISPSLYVFLSIPLPVWLWGLSWA